MEKYIRVKAWLPCRTSKSYGFYPTPKYIGQIINDDGSLTDVTGKCGTRRAAFLRALDILNQRGCK